MIILAVIGFLVFRRRQKRQQGRPNSDVVVPNRSPLNPTPYPPMQQTAHVPMQQTQHMAINDNPRFVIPPGGAMMTPGSEHGSLLMSTPAMEHVALLPQRQTAILSPNTSNSNSPGANRPRHSNSAYTAYTNDTPPAYIGPAEPRAPLSTLGSESAAGTTAISLSQYAQENRGVIPEDLEAKLQRAGYAPMDDPDSISEDDWRRDWGVTKLELARLRALYQRGLHAGSASGSSFSPSSGGWQSHTKR